MDSGVMGSRLRSATRVRNAVCARTLKMSPKSPNSNGVGHHRTHQMIKNNNSMRSVHHSNHHGLSRNNSLHRNNSIHKHCNNNIRNQLTSLDRNANQQQQQKVTTAVPIRQCEQPFLAGKFSREVYNMWCEIVGASKCIIPVELIQKLLNALHLYPSNAQVYKILQYANMCRNNNGNSSSNNNNGNNGNNNGDDALVNSSKMPSSQQFLTFGEFCVIAGELRRHTHIHQRRNSLKLLKHNAMINNVNNKMQTKYEVFLGGSCNPTTWRADIAIPTLNKLGISYYNPQVPSWSPELIATEHKAKQSADVLLFVLDSETRCLAGMVEVALLAAAERCLVVAVLPYKPRQLICNEEISPQEYLDLWYGQSTLLTLIHRGTTPVFTSVNSALHCTVRMLRDTSNLNYDCAGELNLVDRLNKLRDAFKTADHTKSDNLSLSEVCEAYHMVTGGILSLSDLKLIVRNNQNHANGVTIDDMRITFDQFCGIVTEFTMSQSLQSNKSVMNLDQDNNGSMDIHNNRDWASNQSLQRQFSGNNNTNYTNLMDNDASTGQITTYQNKMADVDNSIIINNCRDIYLGGSCSDYTTWRDQIALPIINQCGLTYHSSNYHEITESIRNITNINDDELDTVLENIKNQMNVEVDIDKEMKMINNSRVLLFVITSSTRSIAPMMLVAHCIGLRKYNVVLCIQKLPEDNCWLGNEKLTSYAIKDYNRSRTYLADMARREGVPVFESIEEATQCAVNISLRR